jgi:oxygen-independent coproporphyrinogen-3 oxidase
MFGLYVHIPFCPQQCPYCAFATVVGHDQWHERYCRAVCRELELSTFNGEVGTLDTIFFGGGTPSHVEPGYLETILEAAQVRFGFSPHPEISLEANPGVADARRFAEIRSLGFNRLSIGVQSFTDRSLKILGRIHSAEDGLSAYEQARKAGFENVSIDLISGVPDVPTDDWKRDIRTATELAPEHISIYGLTVEEGTVLHNRQRQGRWQPATEEADCRAIEYAVEKLEKAGYSRYEVSNFSKPGYRSSHNWGYWTGGHYLGAGVSAHSFDGFQRYWNVRELREYVEMVEAGQSTRAGDERIDSTTSLQERLWLGLRTTEGVNLTPGQTEQLNRAGRFHHMRAAGLLELRDGHLKLTQRGFLLADSMGIEVTELLEEACV